MRVSGLGGQDDVSHFLIRSDARGLAMVYPQGGGYGRIYAFLSGMGSADFRGAAGFRRLVAVAADSGVPEAVIGGARPEGPLAAFVAGDSWIETPYRDGLAVVGDAAA